MAQNPTPADLLKTLEEDPKALLKAVQQIDRNGDHKLSPQEIAAWILQHQNELMIDVYDPATQKINRHPLAQEIKNIQSRAVLRSQDAGIENEIFSLVLKENVIEGELEQVENEEKKIRNKTNKTAEDEAALEKYEAVKAEKGAILAEEKKTQHEKEQGPLHTIRTDYSKIAANQSEANLSKKMAEISGVIRTALVQNADAAANPAQAPDMDADAATRASQDATLNAFRELIKQNPNDPALREQYESVKAGIESWRAKENDALPQQTQAAAVDAQLTGVRAQLGAYKAEDVGTPSLGNLTPPAASNPDTVKTAPGKQGGYQH